MHHETSDSTARRWYLRIWRWHFYAGIVSQPMVILLASSGTIYLCKPQIDDWQERRFIRLPLEQRLPPFDEQVAAARQSLPAARLKDVERQMLLDLHAVTGFWVAIFALFFLISALPWTKVWGGSMKQIRAALTQSERPADWTTGPASEHAMHMKDFGQSSPSSSDAGNVTAAANGISFDRVAEIVRPLKLAGIDRAEKNVIGQQENLK